MRWLGVTAALAFGAMCVVALVIVLRQRPGLTGSVSTVREEELFGGAAADLDKAFAAVEAEGLLLRRRLVVHRLQRLRSHRVPLRRLAPSPGAQVARLGFADGTVLLARSASVGEFATVARLHHRGGLVVEGYADHPLGVTVTLLSPARRARCSLVVVGLDQAD